MYKLIADTIAYCKDPLLNEGTLFTSPEEQLFFGSLQKEIKKIGVPQQISPPPIKKRAPIAPIKKEEVAPEKPVHSSYFPKIKETLLKIAPHLTLVDEPPSDDLAKRIAASWKEMIPHAEVILLKCSDDPRTLQFLKNLAKAIDQKLKPAKIIAAERLEKEKRWDFFLERNSFRLIVASEGMERFPALLQFYRAVPAQSACYLKSTPLIVLEKTSTYTSEKHKVLLWNQLCEILKTP